MACVLTPSVRSWGRVIVTGSARLERVRDVRGVDVQPAIFGVRPDHEGDAFALQRRFAAIGVVHAFILRFEDGGGEGRGDNFADRCVVITGLGGGAIDDGFGQMPRPVDRGAGGHGGAEHFKGAGDLFHAARS